MNNTKIQNASLKEKCQNVLLEGLSALHVKVTGKFLPKHSIHLKGYFVTITAILKSIQYDMELKIFTQQKSTLDKHFKPSPNI